MSQHVEAFIAQQKQPFTNADIEKVCPGVRMATITKVVRELRKAEKLDTSGVVAVGNRWFGV